MKAKIQSSSPQSKISPVDAKLPPAPEHAIQRMSLGDELISAVYLGQETLTFRMGEKYLQIKAGPCELRTPKGESVFVEIEGPAIVRKMGELSASEICANGYPIALHANAAELRAGRVAVFLSGVHWYGKGYPDTFQRVLDDTRESILTSGAKVSSALKRALQTVGRDVTSVKNWEKAAAFLEKECPECFRFVDVPLYGIRFSPPDLTPQILKVTSFLRTRIDSFLSDRRLEMAVKDFVFIPGSSSEGLPDGLVVILKGETEAAVRKLAAVKNSNGLLQMLDSTFTPEKSGALGSHELVASGSHVLGLRGESGDKSVYLDIFGPIPLLVSKLH